MCLSCVTALPLDEADLSESGEAAQARRASDLPWSAGAVAWAAQAHALHDNSYSYYLCTRETPSVTTWEEKKGERDGGT
jgi:hypothetical protein